MIAYIILRIVGGLVLQSEHVTCVYQDGVTTGYGDDVALVEDVCQEFDSRVKEGGFDDVR